MKFNCGPDAVERMNIHWRQKQKERAYNAQWHKVFAWWPIRIASGDCRWFEYVERRDKGIEKSEYSGSWFIKEWHKEYEWEYRAINA